MCQHNQLACIYVKCTIDVPGALRVQKRAMEPQEPELWKTVVVGTKSRPFGIQQVLLTTKLSLWSLILIL